MTGRSKPAKRTARETGERAHARRMKALKAEQDAKVRQRKGKRALLIVNTGDGKGKSTAGFGIAFRAAGQKMRVAVVQFIKGPWKTGEGEAFKRFPEITHVTCGEGFTWDTQNRAQDVATARRGWETALGMIRARAGSAPRHHVVVLDELNVVLSLGYLPVAEVVEALRTRPSDVHVVVTGRGAPSELVVIADTVTEMRPIKHAFDAGIRAQRGIEF
jgi:cob(I)alamin adenosyltransferase